MLPKEIILEDSEEQEPYEEYISSALRWLNSKYKTNCVHKWSYNGHGHNEDYFTCAICGIKGEY